MVCHIGRCEGVLDEVLHYFGQGLVVVRAGVERRLVDGELVAR